MTYHECTDVEHLMVLNAVFRNLLFINLFRYIIADDNLLEKVLEHQEKIIAQIKSHILVCDSVKEYAIIQKRVNLL